MGDVSEIAGAIKSGLDLVLSILDRADRDGPEKDFHEHLVKIQNAFAKDDIDSHDFRLFIDELCNNSNHPLIASRDPEFARRILIQTLLVITAEAIRDKRLLIKAIHALQKK